MAPFIPFTLVAAFVWIALLCMTPKTAFAHCDTMDGPVVTAAKKALETGNVNLVLIWIPKEDEAEIEAAFQKTLSVRKLNAEAKELADLYFFETLVRIHRQGEGAAYTGLKPAGLDLGPAIPAADKALETAKVAPLLKLLLNAVEHGVHDYYEQALSKRNFGQNDVEAGRESVAAYVTFVHYVLGIYEAATSPPEEHGAELE